MAVAYLFAQVLTAYRSVNTDCVELKIAKDVLSPDQLLELRQKMYDNNLPYKVKTEDDDFYYIYVGLEPIHSVEPETKFHNTAWRVLLFLNNDLYKGPEPQEHESPPWDGTCDQLVAYLVTAYRNSHIAGYNVTLHWSDEEHRPKLLAKEPLMELRHRLNETNIRYEIEESADQVAIYLGHRTYWSKKHRSVYSKRIPFRGTDVILDMVFFQCGHTRTSTIHATPDVPPHVLTTYRVKIADRLPVG